MNEKIVSKIIPLIDLNRGPSNAGKPQKEVEPECFIPVAPKTQISDEKSDETWIQENILDKIKDYNQGISYQKIIAKASPAQIDKVIKIVRF